MEKQLNETVYLNWELARRTIPERVAPGVMRRLNGEVIIRLAHRLFRLGLRECIVWDRFDGARTLAQLANFLAQENSLPAEQVHTQLVLFAQMLEERGLLIRLDSSDGTKDIRSSALWPV